MLFSDTDFGSLLFFFASISLYAVGMLVTKKVPLQKILLWYILTK